MFVITLHCVTANTLRSSETSHFNVPSVETFSEFKHCQLNSGCPFSVYNHFMIQCHSYVPKILYFLFLMDRYYEL